MWSNRIDHYYYKIRWQSAMLCNEIKLPGLTKRVGINKYGVLDILDLQMRF